MSTPDHTPSSRRTPYQKFSDKVFSLTGMPVGRVLIFIVGLLALGWALQYAMREDDQAAQQKSIATKKQDFLTAITIPKNLFNAAFPIQIEKLDGMIGRCNQLLSQKSEYSDRVQEKLLALLALKAIAMAQNKLDPTQALEQFQKNADQISGSLAQQDKYQYLIVSAYMTVMAANPDLDFYNQTTAAVNGIQEATPVPRTQAIASFKSALGYYDGCKNKVKSGELVQLLGERMSLAKERSVSDFGASLVDYPNYYSSYKGSLSQLNVGSNLNSEIKQLLRQLEETPPHSLQTYNVLMNVPEQLLHAENKEVALIVLKQLYSAASSSPSRIRDSVLPKILRLKTRTDLLGSPFPLSGFDVNGEAIGPPENEQTILFFYNPYKMNSINALRRVADSPLREGWSTTTYFVPVAELQDDSVLAIKELDSNFIVVDGPTSKDWLEKSGVERVPYLIRLDQAGVVQRLRFP